MKQVLIVMIGSALGGGLRYVFSQWLKAAAGTFPLSTFAVNVLGCLVIGFVSGWPATGLSAQTRLLLTTGFCGGFTTFSTFANEGFSLAGNGHTLLSLAYMALSLVIGFAAVAAGHALAKTI